MNPARSARLLPGFGRPGRGYGDTAATCAPAPAGRVVSGSFLPTHTAPGHFLGLDGGRKPVREFCFRGGGT